VTRDALARFLVAFGSRVVRNSFASAWAMNAAADAVTALAGGPVADDAYAFRTVAQPAAQPAALQFAAGAGNVRAFNGTAYGGGIITDHPVWDAVAFDLASTKAPPSLAVLFDHRIPIGVGKAKIDREITIAGELFADVDPQAKSVAEFADRGMPWQMSVYIKPGRIDQVKAGTSINLNGRRMAGPLAVFRDARLREISFVALGADHTTSARVA
jgi:hypothetical protein